MSDELEQNLKSWRRYARSWETQARLQTDRLRDMSWQINIIKNYVNQGDRDRAIHEITKLSQMVALATKPRALRPEPEMRSINTESEGD